MTTPGSAPDLDARPACSSDDLEILSCGAVIVAHAQLALATACAVSLRPWLSKERIVIVLNDPNGVSEFEAEQAKGIALVVSPAVPQGYGANLNLGVALLRPRPKAYLLSNDDVIYEAGSLTSLLHAMRDERVGIVGPKLRGPDGNSRQFDLPFDRFPPLLLAFSPYNAVLPRPLWNALQHQAAAYVQTEGSEVATIVGASMLVRREAFEEVGGFDEGFFLYHEETDFCFRVSQRGWRVAWCRDAAVTHLQGESIPETGASAAAYASLQLYFRKRLGPMRWTLVSAAFVMIFVGSSLYSAAAGALQPRTISHRASLLRNWWRNRLLATHFER